MPAVTVIRRFDRLLDVDMSGAADGDAAVYDADTQKMVAAAIGAPSQLLDPANQVTDWNTATGSGWYGSNPGVANNPPSSGSGYYVGIVSQSHLGPSYVRQVLYELNSDGRWTRRRDGGAWGAWVSDPVITVAQTAPASPAVGDLWIW